MGLIQKIKEQDNQACVLLNNILQTKVVFVVPDKDRNSFIDYIVHGHNFNWGFDSFEDIKALFENFNILQSIIVTSGDKHFNYVLSDTYMEEQSPYTMIEKVFTKIDLDGVGSGDDYEAAVTKRSVSITVFVDNNGEIDIEETLNNGRVHGKTSAVKGTGH